MNLDKNIALIGFMGSGKTTLGRLLAKELRRPFWDTDKIIEESEGMAVREIFAQRGEAYFRQAEAAAAKRLSAQAGAIISTGGGMVKTPEAMEALGAASIIIYLKADADEVLRRTKGDGARPLLSGGDKAERVRGLLGERQPLYEKYADITVDTCGRSVVEILGETVSALKKLESDNI